MIHVARTGPHARYGLAPSGSTLPAIIQIAQVNSPMSDLIPKHGGYRNLKSFQIAQLAYDITVRFCDRYIDRFSRTKDQMVQAARSSVQIIAEVSQTSATSKKT